MVVVLPSQLRVCPHPSSTDSLWRVSGDLADSTCQLVRDTALLLLLLLLLCSRS